jgi:trehalose-6-phosphate synthase
VDVPLGGNADNLAHPLHADFAEADGERNMILQPASNLKVMKPATTARLIVVSNRLPLTLQKTEEGWRTIRSSGGLASAMNPLLAKTRGDWIGWGGAGDSEADDFGERRAILAEWAEKDHCFAVNLPKDVVAGFYEGYANQTLWPVFHNFPSQLKFDARD